MDSTTTTRRSTRSSTAAAAAAAAAVTGSSGKTVSTSDSLSVDNKASIAKTVSKATKSLSEKKVTVEKNSPKADSPSEAIDVAGTIEDDICYELTDKEMKEVNNAFDLNCPRDGDEMLGSDQLKTAIRSLGYEPRANEIKKLISKFSNKKGKINRDGFHRIMAFKMGSTPNANKNETNDEISKVFNLLDIDKTGMITIDNLRSIAKELNEVITDEELQEMIDEADTDGDQQINKFEFHEIMKKTSLY